MNSRMCRGFGCKGSVNTASLQIGQREGGTKDWRGAKSYGSPCWFRVATEYRVDSIRSICPYPDALVTRFLHKPCINRAYMKVDCINDAFLKCRLGFSSRTGTYHSDEMTRGTLFLFYTCDVRIILYIYNVFTYGTKIPH